MKIKYYTQCWRHLAPKGLPSEVKSLSSPLPDPDDDRAWQQLIEELQAFSSKLPSITDWVTATWTIWALSERKKYASDVEKRKINSVLDLMPLHTTNQMTYLATAVSHLLRINGELAAEIEKLNRARKTK